MVQSLDEIIEIAIAIEETGYEFYNESRKKVANQTTADIFEFLAGEELEHKKKFLLLKDSFGAPDRPPEEERFRYLKIMGEEIFNTHKDDIDMVLKEIDTPLAVIKRAFLLEKESILFYSEMKPLYGSEQKTIELIEKIIAEERKHVTVLYDLTQKLRLT